MDSAAHFEIIQPINKWPAYGLSNHLPESTNESAYILKNLRSLHAMMPTDCDCVDWSTAFKSIWHTKDTWNVIIEAIHARLNILQKTQAGEIKSRVREEEAVLL